MRRQESSWDVQFLWCITHRQILFKDYSNSESSAESYSDLSEARELVKCGSFEDVQMLYDDVPDTLSQLIRTAFIPRQGMKFIVADFSAIEARVIAWLAGEEWRMKAFANGEDIYCASASKDVRCACCKAW